MDTFNKIQYRLKKGDSISRIRQDVSNSFPLRGLVTCSHCSQKLTGAPCKGRTKTYLYYYCINKQCSLYSKMLSKEKLELDFEILLQRNRLKSDIDQVVQLTFDRVWKEEVHDLKKEQQSREQRKQDLMEKIRGFSDLARTAGSEMLRRTFETQIEEDAQKLEQYTASEGTESDIKVPYRTAFEKTITLLKNPVIIWNNVDVNEKHRLFFFLFEELLSYTKNEGYRTADNVSVIRIFEEFVRENTDYVDPRRFELLTFALQKHCSTS